MKKTVNRALSLLLALTFLLSMVNLGTAAAVVQPLQYITSDNFEDANVTAAQWANLFYADASSPNLAVSAVSSEHRIMPSTWSDSVKPLEMTFDFKYTEAFSGEMRFVLAYDPVSAADAGLKAVNETGLLLRNWHNGCTDMSNSDNGGKFILNPNNQWASAGGHSKINVDYNQWITVKAEYDWSQWDSANKLLITYTAKVFDLDQSGYRDVSALTITYTFPENHGETVMPAFYSADSSQVLIDNITLVTTGQKADAFTNLYSTVLDMTSAAENETLFLNAANAYMALDGQTQKHLSAYGEKITSLESGLEASLGDFASDNFENAWYSSKYWVTTGITDRKTEGDNSFLRLDNGASITVADALWPEASKAQKASFSFRFGEGTGKFYLLYDKATGTGAYISFHDQDGGYFLKGMTDLTGISQSPNDNDSKLATIVKSPGWVNGNIYRLGDWQRDQWTTVDAVYDYSDWEANRKIKITYTVTLYGYNWKFDGENNFLENDPSYVIDQVILPEQTFTYTLPEGTAPDLSIAAVATAGHIDLDNISVGAYYSGSGEQATVFAGKYGELLDKAPEELTPDEKLLIQVAITEYCSMDARAQSILTSAGVTEKLQKFVTASEDGQNFHAQYASLLAKEDENVNLSYSDQVQAALSQYNALSASDRLALTADYTRLRELEALISMWIEPRPENNYDPFTEDFESGLKQWVWESSERDAGLTRGNEIAIVTDPKDTDNQVLWVKSYGDYLTINDRLLPKDGVMTRYTGKILYTSNNMEGSAGNKNRFILSYVDPDNYTGIGFSSSIQNTMTTLGFDDGDTYGSGWGGSTSSEAFIATEWITFEITYSGTTATIVFTDMNGETKSGSAVTLVQNGTIAFGSLLTNDTMMGFYVDDLKIEYKKADFDVNEPPQNIVVYYQGNTQLRPGEIVTLEGENLYKTVEKLEICQVPNTLTNANVPGYISEESFLNQSAQGGVGPYWDENSAIQVQVLQTTSVSFKFRIPESFTQGVYAVKLYAKIDGQADKIIYINNPEISFVIGDDGQIATQGGWIKVVGSNVSNAQDAAKILVALKAKGGAITILDQDDIDVSVLEDENRSHPYNSNYNEAGEETGAGSYRWDDYAVKLHVPEDLSPGTYEVLVYNGFGNDTCWSQPGSITIGTAARDTWPTDVFNVMDYGAKGNTVTNDTPAVISALEALAQNGGGVLYFPMGIYRLVTTVALPENVKLMGDGQDKTFIMWTATQWMPGEAPDTLLSFGGNVEICHVSIYATRKKTILLHNGGNNVYLHDIHLQCSTNAGGASAGDATSIGDETNGSELKAMFQDEAGKADAVKFSGGKLVQKTVAGQVFDTYTGPLVNLQMINVTNEIDYTNMGYTGKVSYSNINNVEWNHWSDISSTEATLMENCYTGEGSCVGNSGNVYMKNNYWEGGKSNNHEILTTDGTHKLDGATMKQIDATTYELLNNKYGKNELLGWEVYIISGQGLGQMRKIVANDGTQITIDQPFVVTPNRNSLIAIHHTRANQFWVDNTFCNGGASGTYGSMINTVVDNNLFIKHGGQILNTHSGVNWYITIVGNRLENPWYMHGQGLGNTAQGQTEIGHWQFLLLHGVRRFSSQAILFKNNEMLDGSYFSLNTNSKYTRDFVMEGNYFSEYIKEAGVVMSVDVIDGLLLTGNIYDCETPYTDALQSCFERDTKNNVGSVMYITLDTQPEYTKVRGDLDMNGTVATASDVQHLREYLVGSRELTRAQLDNADINSDGKVDLTDVVLLSSWQATGMDPTDQSNSYFPGIW